jgi:hypothetical protein
MLGRGWMAMIDVLDYKKEKDARTREEFFSHWFV